jgi:DNA-binding NarL/FixJ family response regulator
VKLPRVLLVDDTPEILALCVEVLRLNFEVVGTVADGHSAIGALANTTADVVVLDIAMPGLDGVEVARRLRGAGCPAAIVFFSVDMDFLTSDVKFMAAALQAGGTGFVAKRLLASDLPLAIQEAVAGRVFVSDSRLI